MQWDAEGGERTIIADTNIVEGMNLWSPTSENWSGEVQLSQRFHDHLREHAVPLDRRGIALLSDNSLGLDLYALFAYRLPRLKLPLKLTWRQLQGQIGSECEPTALARKVLTFYRRSCEHTLMQTFTPSHSKAACQGTWCLIPRRPQSQKQLCRVSGQSRKRTMDLS